MDQICDLDEKYDVLVMVAESHSAGVVGATGHGVSELYKTVSYTHLIANWGRKFAERECIKSEQLFISRQFKTSLERYQDRCV